MPSRPGLDRRMIVQRAAQIADEQGLNNLTLAAVATQLGVRLPSLYNHIGGLSNLNLGLAALGMRELGAQLGKAAIGKTGDEAIMAIAAAYRTFAHTRPGLYEATLHAPDPDDAEVQAEVQNVVDILLTVLQPYGLSGDDALHVVRGLRSVAHGFVSLEAAGTFGHSLALDESYHQLISTFMQGLKASAAQK